MDILLTAADLSFVLCGLIVTLGALLVWAIHTADRWIAVRRPVPIERRRR